MSTVITSTALRRALARGNRSAAILEPLRPYPYLLKLATVECANAAQPGTALYSSGGTSAKRRKLVQNFRAVGIGRELVPANDPHARLVSFLQLLNHFGKAPWASGKFPANELILMRLTAAHMALITWCPKPHPSLYDMLSIPNEAPHAQQTENVIWITNRQQGKTTNIGRFIAALALSAKPQAMLATVYSTKQDRAAELVHAAKRYYHWLATEDGRHEKWPAVTLTRDNERGFSVAVSPTAASSGVLARPKNPDTCRFVFASFFSRVFSVEAVNRSCTHRNAAQPYCFEPTPEETLQRRHFLMRLHLQGQYR